MKHFFYNRVNSEASSTQNCDVKVGSEFCKLTNIILKLNVWMNGLKGREYIFLNQLTGALYYFLKLKIL